MMMLPSSDVLKFRKKSVLLEVRIPKVIGTEVNYVLQDLIIFSLIATRMY